MAMIEVMALAGVLLASAGSVNVQITNDQPCGIQQTLSVSSKVWKQDWPTNLDMSASPRDPMYSYIDDMS